VLVDVDNFSYTSVKKDFVKPVRIGLFAALLVSLIIAVYRLKSAYHLVGDIAV